MNVKKKMEEYMGSLKEWKERENHIIMLEFQKLNEISTIKNLKNIIKIKKIQTSWYKNWIKLFNPIPGSVKWASVSALKTNILSYIISIIDHIESTLG